jgi:integrase/recombinase XerD
MAGDPMSVVLTDALVDYLAVRRALGYKLAKADKTLGAFVAHLELRGPARVTVAGSVEWVMTQGTGGQGIGACRRLTLIRGFARYLQALDPAHEVPPTRLIPQSTVRPTPRLYADHEIVALMMAARSLKPPAWARTVEAMIGMLWVTGMRVGEVLRLNIGDIDFATGEATVWLSKFGKSRLVPLDPTTINMLRSYRHGKTTACSPLFATAKGQRVVYNKFKPTFNELAETTGLTTTIGRSPRLHDMRHSFAVRTMIGWYQTDADVHALLPRLSTYLGHVEPSSTYWYLSAAPELMVLVAARIDRNNRAVL